MSFGSCGDLSELRVANWADDRPVATRTILSITNAVTVLGGIALVCVEQHTVAHAKTARTNRASWRVAATAGIPTVTRLGAHLHAGTHTHTNFVHAV